MAKKFDMKKVSKNLGIEAGKAAAIAGGMILSKKFLDTEVIFKNQKPDSFLRKQGGWVKAIAALAVLSSDMVKNDYAKSAIMGVGVEGLITGIRGMTVNKDTGEAFFDKIGQAGGWGAIATQQPGSVSRQIADSVSGTEPVMQVPGSGVSGPWNSPLDEEEDF